MRLKTRIKEDRLNKLDMTRSVNFGEGWIKTQIGTLSDRVTKEITWGGPWSKFVRRVRMKIFSTRALNWMKTSAT